MNELNRLKGELTSGLEYLKREKVTFKSKISPRLASLEKSYELLNGPDKGRYLHEIRAGAHYGYCFHFLSAFTK